MKRTTTSVFVSPVRSQTSLSQIVHGLFERAAGAHRPFLPVAQAEQAKSLSGMAGGSPVFMRGCRFFMLLILMLTHLTASAVVQTEQKTSTQPAAALPATNNVCNSITPDMVVIRPGRFQMGSPENEPERLPSESPQHQVTIPRPFAIGRCEITVAQFKKFIEETQYKTTAETDGKGCYGGKDFQQKPEYRWNNPGFVQTDNHPVVCVSWQDAQKYVGWLSQRTGAVYRLPTEAEWEYVARADTQTSWFWGNDEKLAEDYAWFYKNSNKQTHPVGQKKPNAFGLYDTAGNVWEWTLDCWHENYKAAPIDGSAWLEKQGGDCVRRVVRGGSWIDFPQFLRSASRNRGITDEADINLGFRVARAL